MRDFKIDNKGSARLFDNRILERLTRTHFSVPVFIYLLIAVLSVYYGVLHTLVEPLKLIYLFPIGFVTFTLVEYLIHRYIFHFNPSNEKQEKLQYSIHGVHHEFPRDKDRLVMPPVLSMVIAVAFFGFFMLI
jgi:sterol desaturase/sphingolipid hydroxylase (fatty acid hydroxylase superfamily)